ncbi:MAG: sulfotransferase family protein [Acidiferrobacteraceae bacterium]
MPLGHKPPLHFLSGLPRSGSTLLAALLRQNPRVHAEMSGPVAGLFSALLGEMSGKNEFSVFISDTQRQRILTGLFAQYYADCSAEVIIDTHRFWCTKLPALKILWPDSKVIACVRDVAWIIDSLERLVRQNALQPSSIFHYQPGGTVYTRTNGVAGPEGLVGFAYDALKEAFYGEEADRLLLVQYETLVTNPAKVLSAVYAFLNETPFTHTFTQVTYDATVFDEKAGTPGLHTVRSEVKAVPRKTILPPDLFRRFAQDAFWKDPQNNPRGVQVV